MNAQTGVVKTAVKDSLLDSLVVAALSARKALAVFGSILVVFCLGASVVIAPALDADPPLAAQPCVVASNLDPRIIAPDAAREGRSPARIAARTGTAAPRRLR